MKLLRPVPAVECRLAPPSLATVHRSIDQREAFPPPSEAVHVAVGTSPEKTRRLLEWTFLRFRCREAVLVHIHRPSPTIPTLLGNLPAKQANEKLVSAHRLEEWRNTEKILLCYLSFCYRSQVQPKIILAEAEDIEKGIVDVVNRHGIQKLLVGASPDKFFKVKGVFSKAIHATTDAPSFCEIWFVKKGKLVFVRKANEVNFAATSNWNKTFSEEMIRTSPLQNQSAISMPDQEWNVPATFTTTMGLDKDTGRNLPQFYNAEETILMPDCDISQSAFDINSENNALSASTTTSLSSPCKRKSPIKTDLKGEPDLEMLSRHLEEITAESEKAKKEVYVDLSKRKELECAIVKAVNMVKASEVSHLREIKFREKLEAVLVSTKLQKNELVSQKNVVMKELQSVMRNVAVLNGYAHGIALHRDEAAGELEKVLLSIAALKVENQKIRHQRDEYVRQIGRLRCRNHASSKICNKFMGFGNGSLDFKEFSLSDLQAATFGFSDTFVIGQGGHGCVYKGEMLSRSVAIKKFHHHIVRGQQEFQQEVFILGKLRHPHLVTLIGACPEALSLVYEYLPNGTLHDHLICKTMTPPLNWATRVRIAAEISSSLLFLHSSKPEKIVHGDLKPMNIFLDYNLSCKIGGFGFCELVPDQIAAGHTMIRQKVLKSPCGEFPYSDPEYQRTGILSSKSDVYSFGIIVLQLLTGRPPLGLATEVRRAVLTNRLSAVLDMTAGEWSMDVAEKLAEFALKCTEMNGRNRPELTPAVVRDLEQLHTMQERPVPSSFLCPILQEIMYDPHVAADGFSYEGSAFREWLANGRESSPMTNLRLENLNLIPNHELRLAVQDWLCQAFQC